MKALWTTLAGAAAATLLAHSATAAPVAFSQGYATYSQPGFSPTAMFDGSDSYGWAIADSPGGTESQSALLVLATPLAAGSYDLTFVANQFFVCCNSAHTLGEFSFGYTTDAAPTLASMQTLVSYTGGSSLTGSTFTFSGGHVFASGGGTTDAYTINGTINSAAAITGIFLNVHESANGYPTNGPGRAFNGNFVVTELTLDATLVRGTGAVPEPATWAMMILGFGAAGSALRSRRRTVFNATVG
ncbi:PEPxxWA-CTERM sorting domain-containing protein [Phenylobacterium sp.]|uniref:PEPxxWA-CTERM sorting domain-containing protein n=1 Tax=Phenylobacterium sp. TaxID=1871053 RepID=UPI003D28B208